MKYFIHVSLLFLYRLATAAISLQEFASEQCTGSQVGSVLSNAGNQFDSSGCVPSNQFHSVTLITADPGFVCNIYADTACANFPVTLEPTAPGTCVNVIGAGAICFSQALFDNPLADSTAAVVIGGSSVTIALPSDNFGEKAINLAFGNAIDQACGDKGCSPTTVQTTTSVHQTCETFEIEVCKHDATCQQTIQVNGNDDNTNQRDYMKGLLLATFVTANKQDPNTDGILTSANDTKGVGGLNPIHVLSFASVVLNDAKGNNLAEMSVEVDMQCSALTPRESGCNDTFKTVVDAALGLVPDVGGLVAAAFDLSCQAFS
ncbi:hypothetical protein H2200_011650 [Cladophialophora chaetospira]|uniref:Uncharacterized protein n=1 Tax=Cladophialophora chaetospira TaxID=386627 RepID=A0AA38WZU2_9EURO|nr:hypothetical protein H2200_011650 [Cladophialophora chaetospira]